MDQIAQKGNWLIASLEYASYNSILLIPILIELKQYTHQKEKSIAIIVSAILFLLAMVIYMVLLEGGVNSSQVELPIIYVVNKFGKMYQYVYGMIIVSAICTTAISAGYSFLENCSKNKKKYQSICILMCILAPFIANLGFSYLVNLLYPVFGILGLIQIIYLIFHGKLEKLEKN